MNDNKRFVTVHCVALVHFCKSMLLYVPQTPPQRLQHTNKQSSK